MINPWLVPHHGEVIDPHFHFFDLSDCSTSGQDPKVIDFQVENKGEFGEGKERAGKECGKVGVFFFFFVVQSLSMLLEKMHEGIFANIYCIYDRYLYLFLLLLLLLLLCFFPRTSLSF